MFPSLLIFWQKYDLVASYGYQWPVKADKGAKDAIQIKIPHLFIASAFSSGGNFSIA